MVDGSILDLLFPTVGAETFLAKHLGSGPIADSPGLDALPHLLDWAGLNGILAGTAVGFPTLRLVRHGELVPEGRYTYRSEYEPRRLLRMDRLLEELRTGATLILQAVDELHPPTAAVGTRLQRMLGDSVKVLAFASWHSERGLDTHWDDGDAFIVQLRGRKQWEIYPNDRPWPLHLDEAQPQPPTGEPALVQVTGPGDVLYIPRGWWHRVGTVDGPSLHVSFQVRARTGIDLLSWVAERLREHAEFRRTLAFAGSDADRAAQAAELRAILLDAYPDDVVTTYRDHLAAVAHPQLSVALPAVTPAAFARSLAGGGRVRLLTRGRPVLETAGGRTRLSAGGRTLTLHAAAGPILTALLDGVPVLVTRLEEVAARHDVSPSELHGLLGELYALGLVSVGP